MTLTPLAQPNLPGSFDSTESTLDLPDIANFVSSLKPAPVLLESLGFSVTSASAYLAILHWLVVSSNSVSRYQQAVTTCVGSCHAQKLQHVGEEPSLRRSAMGFGKRLFKIRLQLDGGVELILELSDLADEPPQLHVKGAVDEALYGQSLCFLEEQLRTLFPFLTVVHSDKGGVSEQGAHGKASD